MKQRQSRRFLHLFTSPDTARATGTDDVEVTTDDRGALRGAVGGQSCTEPPTSVDSSDSSIRSAHHEGETLSDDVTGGCDSDDESPSWPRRDSNPDDPFRSADFKSAASANSATGPVGVWIVVSVAPAVKSTDCETTCAPVPSSESTALDSTAVHAVGVFSPPVTPRFTPRSMWAGSSSVPVADTSSRSGPDRSGNVATAAASSPLNKCV